MKLMTNGAFGRIILSMTLWQAFPALTFAQATTAPHAFTEAQPQMISLGGRASFTTDLNSSATYQWHRDGEVLASGTNRTMTLTNLSFTDSGGYYCVIANDAGAVTSKVSVLKVVPVTQLRTMASVPAEGFAMWIKAQGTKVYVADNKLQIYDVSDRPNPVKLGAYGSSTSKISAFHVVDSLAYCLDGTGFALVDVSNPTAPVLVKKVTLPFTGLDVAARDGIAYIGGTSGLVIYDVKDPATPVKLSQVDSGSAVYTVDTADTVLFSASTSKKVQLYDVSDPAQPAFIKALPEVSTADTVKVSENRLYAAGSGFAIYDIANARQPKLLGTPRAQTEAPFTGTTGMTATGDFMFYGGSSSGEGVYIVDASNPAFSGRIGNLKLSGRVEGADWSDGLLYVAHGKSWSIVQWDVATNAPVVTAALRDALAVAGTQVRLEAAASGGEPLAWKWLKEGVEIPGETNRVLTIPKLSETDIGEYSVLAKNSRGEQSAGSSRIGYTEVTELKLTVFLGDSRGPRLTLNLAPGLEGTVQGSSDLQNWETLWSAQAPEEGLIVFDTSGRNGSGRFYRLKYGVE